MLAFCGHTWWRKPENPGETTDFRRATTTLPHAGTRTRSRVAAVSSECINHCIIQALRYAFVSMTANIMVSIVGVIAQLCLSQLVTENGLNHSEHLPACRHEIFVPWLYSLILLSFSSPSRLAVLHAFVMSTKAMWRSTFCSSQLSWSRQMFCSSAFPEQTLTFW